MNKSDNLEEIKRDYLRAREILRRVSDADDTSLQAVMLRNAWSPQELTGLQLFIRDCEDMGVPLTIRNN